MKKYFVGLLTFALMIILPGNIKAINWDEVKDTKKVTINSVPPTSEALFGTIDEYLYLNGGYTMNECNDDYSVCTFFNYQKGSIEDVAVTWEYDKDVKKVADSILAKIPNDTITFKLTDVETFRFLVARKEFMDKNGAEIESEDDLLNLATYSSEYKNFLGYNNFIATPRFGDMTNDYEMQGGTVAFIYDGTIYGVSPNIQVLLQKVIYIPEDVTDIDKYFKEKFGKYFDEEIGLDDAYEMNLDVMRAAYEDEFKGYYSTGYDFLKTIYPTEDDYVDAMMEMTYTGDDAPGKYLFEGGNLFGDFYIGDSIYTFKIVKDTKKASTTDELITKDVKSNVTISTNSIIPLDTLISVARISSGDEYDKIVNILEQTDIEIFDLSLFSKTIGNNVTKLDDGTFEVKLPIKEEMQGKALVVYYFDQNGEKTKYDVEISEDGAYAIFKTNHFSTYTLAVDPNQNTNNPVTSDKVYLYILMFALSIISISTVSILKKRFN